MCAYGCSGDLKFKVKFAPHRCGDIHQRVQREARHPAPQKIVDASLGHPAALARFGLRPVALLDDVSDLAHQRRTRAQVCRLLGRVGHGAPDAGLGRHRWRSPLARGALGGLHPTSLGQRKPSGAEGQSPTLPTPLFAFGWPWMTGGAMAVASIS